MRSKCSRGGYLNKIVTTTGDKILWSKPSFDISFVEKELSSGSPRLVFLTRVGGGERPWFGEGLF